VEIDPVAVVVEIQLWMRHHPGEDAAPVFRWFFRRGWLAPMSEQAFEECLTKAQQLGALPV
jgi:hypothetical protein